MYKKPIIKRYQHKFCFECGRLLPVDRHGRIKYCSDVCRMIGRRKYRMAWYRRRIHISIVRRKGAIVTNFKRWGHKPHDKNNNTKPNTAQLE